MARMPIHRLVLAVALSSSVVATVAAAPQPTRLSIAITVVEAEKLAALPTTVFIHVGEKPGYDAGHIAGARFLELASLSLPKEASGGLNLQMLAGGQRQVDPDKSRV